MPADLNTVTLIGRPTKDPEIRETRNGTAVGSIRLAFTTRTKDGEEWGDKSNYIDIEVWGRQAEIVGQYVTKGKRIGIDGRLEMDEWTTQEGDRRSTLKVVAQDVQFLDSGGGDDSGGSGGDSY